MSEKALHIVAFAVPYPPNYGGVIDVFYKLKYLHQAGIDVHLHCFTYGNHLPDKTLEKYCKTVSYYPRKTGLLTQFSWIPYIVKSRKVKSLLFDLQKDNNPILFEGLHCCGFLAHSSLTNRLKIYRESNIEHHYYQHLSKASDQWLKKIFYKVEALRLKYFQKTLQHADKMLVVSESDTSYLKRVFPHHDIRHLPSFHANQQVDVLSGKGDYVLYHGKLSVEENLVAATYIIKHIFSNITVPLKIAGLTPPSSLKKLVAQYPHIELIENPSNEEMDALIQHAQIHLLMTFQPTGLKLKLLNTLYKGRHVLVNKHMIAGTHLKSLCHVADTNKEFIQEINFLMKKEFDNQMIKHRTIILQQHYSNEKNLENLLTVLFE